MLLFLGAIGQITNPNGNHGGLVSGPVLILGALIYRSAKQRRNAKGINAVRLAAEFLGLITMVFIAFGQNELKQRMVADPMSNIVIPVWALAAYAYAAYRTFNSKRKSVACEGTFDRAVAMEHATDISLRQAAAAFGPCAGGMDNALRRIIDKLEDDETFWRKFVGDKAKIRGDIIAMDTSDWFRNYSSLSSQHLVGTDADFDEFRDAVEHVLYKTDDLVVDYDEVRSIWFPKDFNQFIPNAELATTWSFTQALAWVATKDLGIVGAIDHLSRIERLGWMAVLLSEQCEECDMLANTPRWQQCHCLTNAFSSLCITALPPLGADELPPTLKPSAVDGCFKANTNSIHLQFDPADIRSIFPAEVSAVVTPSKKKGAKVITDEAKQLWLERRANGHGQRSANREAEFIHKLLTERHRNTGRKVPSAGTIRKRITDWLVELGEVE